VVHLHSVSPRVGLRVARQAAARRLPIVLTYHTPTVTCRRGTLMKWGSTPCSGKLDVNQCTACILNSRGVPPLLAGTIATVSAPIGKLLESRRIQGGAWTALRMHNLISHSQTAIHKLLAEVDAVVAPARWVVDVLRINGVPLSKVTYCPQGVPFPDVPRTHDLRQRGGPLRIVSLARIDKAKGLQTIVEALARDRGLAVTFDIYGQMQHEADGFGAQLRRRIATDPRIRLHDAIAPRDVVPTLRDYDVLATSSQGFETGPLVVLEAFAAGIPVIGSDLGGVAERVRHEVNGLLVPFSDSRAWMEAIRRLSTDAGVLDRLRIGITKPRTMDAVAEEMKELYSALRRSGEPDGARPDLRREVPRAGGPRE
jgi:glycosyltransferase involved in cell wall biosynthesis